MSTTMTSSLHSPPSVSVDRTDAQNALAGLESLLEEQIQSGHLKPGHRIKPAREISKDFGVAYHQAAAVLRRLEQRGYVRAVRGSGTYVCDVRSKSSVQSVALAIRTSGDVYSDFTKWLLGGLHSANIIPGIVAMDQITPSTPRRQVDSIFQKLLSENPTVLVLDASSFEENISCQLEEYERRGGQIIEIFGVHGSFRFATQIYPDVELGLYKATCHMLVEHGYDDIALLTRHCRPGEPRRDSNTTYHLRGFQRAVRQFGNSSKARCIRVRSERSVPGRLDDIRKALTENCPRALVVERDYIAHLAIRVAGELDLRIPDDLAICSVWDVPVAEALDMTSIHWDWSEMARCVVEEIAAVADRPSRARRIIPIMPELVIRSSCGCPTGSNCL